VVEPLSTQSMDEAFDAKQILTQEMAETGQLSGRPLCGSSWRSLFAAPSKSSYWPLFMLHRKAARPRPPRNRAIGIRITSALNVSLHTAGEVRLP